MKVRVLPPSIRAKGKLLYKVGKRPHLIRGRLALFWQGNLKGKVLVIERDRFHLNTLIVGSNPTLAELGYGSDISNQKDEQGSDPSLWKLVGCDLDSNLAIKAKYKQSSKRPDRKRWYVLSGNSYVILKEKRYEEYKSKR